MGDYSRKPLDLLVANQQKGYVGLHIEQGVPILDRDLNLLHDLISATVRSVIARYVGDGIAVGSDGFGIQALAAGQNSQDFAIKAGSGGRGAFLVGGLEVSIDTDTTYKKQPDAPALTTPAAARTDKIYLDAWIKEVDSRDDSDLTNSADVGMQTSVRLKPIWMVRVAEGGDPPAPPPGHVFQLLAAMQRPAGQDTIEQKMITDLRQRRLTMSDIERRLSLLERLMLVPAFVHGPRQFYPQSGVIRQSVNLFGTNFDVGSIEVRFGDKVARIVGAPSANQIVAQIPPGLTSLGQAKIVKLSVSNEGGSDTSEVSFTVRADPVLTDPGKQLDPDHGQAGEKVAINGFNFDGPNPRVLFGSVPATLSGTPSATQIVALIPATLTDLKAKITVMTDAGKVVSDDDFNLEKANPAPVFATPPFLPKSGTGGTPITLFGQNFNIPVVRVFFDTVEATVNAGASATQISVNVPAGLTPAGAPRVVKITVNTGGGSVSADGFTVMG